MIHQKPGSLISAARDAAIAGVVLGTVDFVLVLERTRLFREWSEWASLWLALCFLLMLCVGLLLAVLRPFVAPRYALGIAFLLAIGTWPLESALKDDAPFTDGAVSVVEELPAPAERVSGVPSVLLVTIDTIRNDHVGVPEVETPHLDRLASAGIRLESAYAPIAITGPSHASMLTGAGPWTTGMLLNGVPIPSGVRNLAETMHRTGRNTGAFVSSVVLDPALGFDRGFEFYDQATGVLPGFESSTPGRIMRMAGRRIAPHEVLERPADQTTDQALRWLESLGGEPFFGWVHFFDPHGPYAPPAPFDSAYYTGDPRSDDHQSMDGVTGVAEYLKPSLSGIRDVDWVLAQYAGEVSFVDAQIGRLMDALREAGRLEDTLIVVAGDHGESLGENGVWFNHGGDLDSSAIRVPLIFHWPNHLPRRSSDLPLASVVDVAPTIWGLMGMDSSAPDGVNLFEVSGERAVMSVCYDRTVNRSERAAGRIEAPVHLLGRVWTSTGWSEVGSHASRNPRTEGMVREEDKARISAVLEGLGVAVHRGNSERDPAVVERLRALGYVE